jgi:hypothetical protein
MFLRWRGFNIDTQLFDLKLNEPQNFAQHRQVEIDAARINVFGQLEQVAYFSKRFLMKRYLGLTEEEMSENEEMWLQEQGETPSDMGADVGLRSVGITPGAISGDLEAADQIAAAPGAAGAEGGGEVGAGALPPGAAASPIGGAAPAGVPATPTGLPQ